MKNKINKNEKVYRKNIITDNEANGIVLGSVTGLVMLAGFSLPVSLGIICATAVGCAYVTVKNK